MKSIVITISLFSMTILSFAQSRPPFSEKTVSVENRTFMPYTKGEVTKMIEGPHKAMLDKICSIITAWDSISPPQGLKVLLHGFDQSIEMFFLPYLFEEGNRCASRGGPKLGIYVNEPLRMFGSPIAPEIFLCPQKITTFHGYPIYQNDHQEVAIVTKSNIPLFIPVSQEEYLKALIKKEEKNSSQIIDSDSELILQEMESAYQQLLKTDKGAAKDFKHQMDEFRIQAYENKEAPDIIDVFALLKKELSTLTPEERNRDAYYGGPWAMEEYNNVSGLIPNENRHKGDALVKYNPALIDNTSTNKVQLLVISWLISESNHDEDKPRLYKDGRMGFHLADDLMVKLYNSEQTWKNIFNIL